MKELFFTTIFSIKIPCIAFAFLIIGDEVTSVDLCPVGEAYHDKNI